MRKYLKDMRKKQGITQMEIADKLGISPSYYAMIEIGQRKPNLTVDIVEKLSIIFGVSLEFILEKEKEVI